MTETHWRKSSYSGQEGNCVEVANTLTALRDSKNANGPTLQAELGTLLHAVKHDLLDQ